MNEEEYPPGDEEILPEPLFDEDGNVLRDVGTLTAQDKDDIEFFAGHSRDAHYEVQEALDRCLTIINNSHEYILGSAEEDDALIRDIKIAFELHDRFDYTPKDWRRS